MSQEKAFLEAFDEHANALFRHCSYRVSDRERAQDIVQDTFMKTWDYISKGKEVREFRPFLYQTLNRLIIDEYRKKKTESLDTLLESGDAALLEAEFTEGSIDELALQLDAQQLTEVLHEMPVHYRQAIVMRYIDGLPPQEIAEITGHTSNVISVHIHRGLAWLRKRVDR